MSMLTPPGMGGKYKITGNTYPRMRRPRRRKAIVTSVALLSAVGVLGWGTVELVGVFTGGSKAGAAQAAPGCASPSASAAARKAAPAGSPSAEAGAPSPHSVAGLPAEKTITVNVYNATTRTGLAKKTSEELKKRGFKIGEVGNAEERYDKKVEQAAVLVGGPRAEKELLVLGAYVKGTRSDRDQREDSSVDLIIGNAYRGLESPQAVQKTLEALTKPVTPKAKAGNC